MKQFVRENRNAQDRPVAIISACKSELPDYLNKVRTNLLRSILKDNKVSFIEAEGCYKNSREDSFICHVPRGADKALIRGLKTRFDQESVLFRGKDGVYLIFSDYDQPLKYEKIGCKLVAVSECTAKSQDAYTYVNGQYFIVK